MSLPRRERPGLELEYRIGDLFTNETKCLRYSFEGGSLLNRAIGHCGYAPNILHRLDMVRFLLLKTPRLGLSLVASDRAILTSFLTTFVPHQCSIPLALYVLPEFSWLVQ